MRKGVLAKDAFLHIKVNLDQRKLNTVTKLNKDIVKDKDPLHSVEIQSFQFI